MRICTWNVRGLGSKRKRSVIRRLLANCGADIIILQETKKVEVDRRLVSSIWGSRFKDWVSIPAFGTAGGLVLIWNTRYVSVLESVVGAFSVSIKIQGVNRSDWWLTGVYGPNGYREDFLLGRNGWFVWVVWV
jgi:mannosylglycoprotein endo-beta-mannosidase